MWNRLRWRGAAERGVENDAEEGMRLRLAMLAAIAATALCAVPGTAQAGTAPQPLGHACFPSGGARFCPTVDLTDRVPSWDGVALDADVTLPATGTGPFPLVVMLHPWGFNKSIYECSTGAQSTVTCGFLLPPLTGVPVLSNYTASYYAAQGYAVLAFSARGWGRSCGIPSSRVGTGCTGPRQFVSMADSRYDARDAQTLIGRLVDEGIARADAIGVTGISLGAGSSGQLAFLKDKIRLPDGQLRAWRSPAGRRLRIAAAYARWGSWSLVEALLPNGRFLDFDRRTTFLDRTPLGIMKLSWNNDLLSSAQQFANLAPANTLPRADLLGLYQSVIGGEPYGANVRRRVNELDRFHDAGDLVRDLDPAPLLMEEGWTDDLFPPEESLSIYNWERAENGGPIALQFGDLGHQRGANKVPVDEDLNQDGREWFDRYLKGSNVGPRPGQVKVYTQTCPTATPAGGPFVARSWNAMRPGAWRLGGDGSRIVTSVGGDPAIARAIDPQPPGTGSPCTNFQAVRAPGTAVYQRSATGFTMVGLPTVKARIRTTGQFGQLDARLWDVAPNGRQTLVARGEYRLRPNQTGNVLFQLHGNAYEFETGNVIKLELVGRDPNYLRPSNGTFSVNVSDLTAELPTLDRPSRELGITRPRIAVLPRNDGGGGGGSRGGGGGGAFTGDALP
jgi:hypothetical protein